MFLPRDSILPWSSLSQVVKIPSNGPMTALLGIIPLQLLAYELAIAKGMCNICMCVTIGSLTIDYQGIAPKGQPLIIKIVSCYVYY